MHLIVITPAEFVYREAEKINALFEAGMKILHIRKPHSTEKEYCKLLEDINKEHHNRIKIHEFFHLTDKYNLLGVHLNIRNPNYAGNKNVNISKSYHSIEELGKKDNYDYVFLSPIFDSISKQGYHSNFSDKVLTQASLEGKINEKVIALGGINPQRFSAVKKYAFGGMAVLGSIWENDNVVENFLNLKSLL